MTSQPAAAPAGDSPALPCSVPALPCPALPCPALPCPAPPCTPTCTHHVAAASAALTLYLQHNVTIGACLAIATYGLNAILPLHAAWAMGHPAVLLAGSWHISCSARLFLQLCCWTSTGHATVAACDTVCFSLVCTVRRLSSGQHCNIWLIAPQHSMHLAHSVASARLRPSLSAAKKLAEYRHDHQ